MQQANESQEFPQYSLGKTLLIWLAAAAPMGILGWLVAPALARGASNPALVRLAVLSVGLLWEFILVIWLTSREAGTMSLSELARRVWLQKPRSPKTGMPDGRMWWWVIPVFLITAVYQMQLVRVIEHAWTSIFPFLAEPASFSMAGLMDSPEGRAKIVGDWGFYIIYIINALLNTVIGEELLFRGVLLPRMARTFGKWDWVANGVLFGFYHWHQPWGMLTSAIDGALMYAFPTRKFKSAWFGIIAHSGQSLFFAFLLLALVLGLAK